MTDFIKKLSSIFGVKENNDIKLETAVFTTRHVINRNSDILHVYHDEDGDWQFFGPEEIDEADAAIVTMREILEIDSSLTTILNIKTGSHAHRNSRGEKWVIDR